MKGLFPCLVFLLLAVALQGETHEPSPQDLPGLPLLGQTSLRAALFFSVADFRLYAEPPMQRTEVLSGKALALEVTYARPIRASTLIRLAENALSTEFDESEIQVFSEPLREIHTAYRDVKAGDSYLIRYLPGQGLDLFLNGEFLVDIPNDAFARFYLHIWLGNHPRARNILDGLFRTKESP